MLRARGAFAGTSLSYNVKKLQEGGYLIQTRSEDDKRTVTLRLTDRGKKVKARVEKLFVENDLTTGAEIKLLEILAQSGTSYSEIFVSYRAVIFVLLVFSTALLIASLVFLVTIIALNRRISAIQRSGIQVASMLISREGRAVYINDMEFALTEAALETLAVLAEARMDDEVLTGAQIEAVISGRNEVDCDEAAGATRVKRLRDTLGNQLVSELLVKTIARRGYMLAVGKDVLKMI